MTELFDQSKFGVSESQAFLDHTNRLSNVVEFSADAADKPHYDISMAVGRSLLYIVNQTDEIQNAAPILGSFTSIFINDELVEKGNLIYSYSEEVANSIITTVTPGTPGEGGSEGTPDVTTYSTSLSSERIAEMVTNVKNLKVLFEKRRKHDENFWTKAKLISDEYSQVKRFKNPGETQQKVLDQYVGSTKYKDSSIIKDVPVKPAFNVSVAYNGTITYTATRPGYNSYVVPSVVVRTTPISGSVDYYSDLPTSGNVIGDEYYVTTTGETYRWNGKSWILISTKIPSSPTISLDDYISLYNNSPLVINISGGYQLTLNPGSLIFETDNGVWSNNRTVTITNTGEKNYPFAGVEVTKFLDSEIEYSFDPEEFTSIVIGDTVTINVSARNLSEGNTVDYGIVTILPGAPIHTKILSYAVQYGILLPSAISQNVGSSTSRLPINQTSGPYAILAADATGPEYWTWRNDSEDSVTISTIENISTYGNTHMTVDLIQANTPNTIEPDGKVQWYANVTPHVEFPNTSIFRVTTSDGQQRLITLGIDTGNVDDSALYTETINTNPDIIVTTTPFSIRIYGGKANTTVSYSGPSSSGTLTLDANGKSTIANNVITNIGTYTWSFNFNGTGHTRTLTKAIFT